MMSPSSLSLQVLLLATVTLLSQCAYDDSTMLQKAFTFSNQGYVFLENILPELRSDLIQDNIRVAKTLAQLEFLIACEERLVLSFNVNCSQVSYPLCRIKWPIIKEQIQMRINAILFDHSEVNFAADYSLFERGIKSLKCCITETNKLLGKKTNNALDKKRDDGIRLPYIQFLNLHRTNKEVMELALNKRLAKIAAFLLDEDRVRLYQTGIFYKYGNLEQTAVGEMLNRQTSWHTDLHMVPLDTSSGGYLTIWCPLTNISSTVNDSLLLFAKKSHRDVASKFWYNKFEDTLWGLNGFKDSSSRTLHEAIQNRYEITIYDNMLVGSCSAHDGWLYQSAPPQKVGSRDRTAIAFSFVSARARTLPAADVEMDISLSNSVMDEDHWSYKDWFYDLAPYALIDHPLLPLVYDATNKSFVADTTLVGNGYCTSTQHSTAYSSSSSNMTTAEAPVRETTGKDNKQSTNSRSTNINEEASSDSSRRWRKKKRKN